MDPVLSIIIATYNHTDKLPELFANIQSQDLPHFEIVVVDDVSDIPCNEVVDAFRNNGLEIQLSRNTTRQYTKDSRLNGVEMARGRFITFIDADDLFYGKHALGYHLQMAMDLKADIVHFASHHLQNGKPMRIQLIHASPIGEQLSGPEIFRQYVASGMNGHTIWGKIVSRSLWQECLAPARALTVRRYCEDLALSSLLFFHARSYVGSKRIGYIREYLDKLALKSFGRSVTYYTLLTEFVPYIREHGADEKLCFEISKQFLGFIKEYTRINLEYQRSLGHHVVDDEMLGKMLEHGDMEKIVRTLVTGML